MSNLLAGDLISDEKLALNLGEILCEALYRNLAEQRPLFAIDEGSYWRVEGSRNRNGEINGIAEFFLSLEKSDGRVADIGEYLRFPPHPSVVPLINEHFAQTQATQTSHDSVGTHNRGAETAGTRTEERGSGILMLTNMARSGVVASGDLAIKIGALYCSSLYRDLQRQAPFIAEDKETHWRVEGNWNRDGKRPGVGSFFLSIEKYDGRVIDIGE